MAYSVGDKVMYPNRGAGTVTEVQHQELVAGFGAYYVIELSNADLMVHVPMKKAGDLGVRPAVSEATLDRLLDVLGKRPERLPDDYKERQEGVREKLATGQAFRIAETVRDLAGHGQWAHLTKVDRRLLEEGRELLAGEMALVTDGEITDAEAVIDTALASAIERAAPN